MTEIVKPKLFNVEGDDSMSSQSIVNGNSTGILNLNNVKYSWVKGFYRVMTGNFWVPERVSMVEDKITIKNLTDDEDRAVQSTLAFLIFLDSLQVNNLPNIFDYVTCPGTKNLGTIQAFQETIHSQSYQYLLEALYPNATREAIYNEWRSNPLLRKRNQFIADTMQAFADNPTLEGFKRVLIANLALEGIYFYCGFNLFDQLASRKKLVQSQKMIDYIRVDEASHAALFSKIIQETMDTQAESEWIYAFMREVAQQEIEWSNSVYGDRILGISPKSTEQYVKYLTNKRLRGIGLAPLFEDVVNPYTHLEVEGRSNFFESSQNTSYSRSEAVDGWDDF